MIAAHTMATGTRTGVRMPLHTTWKNASAVHSLLDCVCTRSRASFSPCDSSAFPTRSVVSSSRTVGLTCCCMCDRLASKSVPQCIAGVEGIFAKSNGVLRTEGPRCPISCGTCAGDGCPGKPGGGRKLLWRIYHSQRRPLQQHK